MYSMFYLLLENPSYHELYVISDSEMKALKKKLYQKELYEINNERLKLEDAFKAQLKHL